MRKTRRKHHLRCHWWYDDSIKHHVVIRCAVIVCCILADALPVYAAKTKSKTSKTVTTTTVTTTTTTTTTVEDESGSEGSAPPAASSTHAVSVPATENDPTQSTPWFSTNANQHATLRMSLTNLFTDNMVPSATGFHFGQWQLHPYLNMDTHWITNPGRMPQHQDTSDVMSVLRPGLRLSRSTPRLALSVVGGANLQRYWGVIDDTTKRFTTVSGDGNINMDILPAFPYGGSAFVQVTRTANIGTQILVERVQHTMVESGVTVRIQPLGGALRAVGSYNFFFDRYDRNIYNAAQLDNYRHRPRLRLDWKFMPKTTVFAETGGELTHYLNKDPLIASENELINGINPQAQHLFNVNANIVNVMMGIDGVIKRKIAATLKVGYVKALIDGSPNAETFAANFDVNYTITPRQKVRSGIAHGLHPVSLFRYFDSTYAYASYSYELPWKMLINVGGSYMLRNYGAPVGLQLSRLDHQVSGVASIVQPITHWLDIAVINTVDYVSSNYVTAQGLASYVFNDFNFRVQVHY